MQRDLCEVVVAMTGYTRTPTLWRPSDESAWPSALTLLVCLLGAASVSAQESAADDTAGAVHYDSTRNRLSVSVKDQPLVNVFERISTETGVGLVVHGSDHGAITAEFNDLPLGSAIKQLLEGRNYALSGAADPDQGTKVWIMAPPQSSPRTSRARLRTARQTPVRTTGRTGQARSRAEETNEQLLQKLSERGDAVENLQELLNDENGLEDMILEAMQGGEVPPELLEIIENEPNLKP